MNTLRAIGLVGITIGCLLLIGLVRSDTLIHGLFALAAALGTAEVFARRCGHRYQAHPLELLWLAPMGGVLVTLAGSLGIALANALTLNLSAEYLWSPVLAGGFYGGIIAAVVGELLALVTLAVRAVARAT